MTENSKVRAAINQLGDEQRMVIVLRYQERVSFEEIARRQGRPLDEIYQVHRQAVKSIAEALNV